MRTSVDEGLIEAFRRDLAAESGALAAKVRKMPVHELVAEALEIASKSLIFKPSPRKCTFCGKRDVQLVAGPNVYVCEEDAKLLCEIFEDARKNKPVVDPEPAVAEEADSHEG